MMLSAMVSMSGCGGLIIYDGSRNESKDVIGRTMAERNPELDSDAAAACVVSGMSIQEVVTLGVSDVRVVTNKTKMQVEELLKRPDVVQDVEAAAVRGDHEVVEVLLHLDPRHRRGGQTGLHGRHRHQTHARP